MTPNNDRTGRPSSSSDGSNQVSSTTGSGKGIGCAVPRDLPSHAPICSRWDVVVDQREPRPEDLQPRPEPHPFPIAAIAAIAASAAEPVREPPAGAQPVADPGRGRSVDPEQLPVDLHGLHVAPVHRLPRRRHLLRLQPEKLPHERPLVQEEQPAHSEARGHGHVLVLPPGEPAVEDGRREQHDGSVRAELRREGPEPPGQAHGHVRAVLRGDRRAAGREERTRAGVLQRNARPEP